MIARHAPYALTPFQAELESLVERVSGGVPSSSQLQQAAADARTLMERMAGGNAPDRTPADVWVGRYDGNRLTISGPRVTAVAGFENGALVSLAIDFPTGSFEWTAEADGVRAQVLDTSGETLAHYRFGADGSVHDEKATAAASPAFDDLFGAPEVADAAPAPAPDEPEKQWYYVLDSKPEGPLPESELRTRLASLPPSTLVWNEGMSEWKSAEGTLPSPVAAPAPVVAPEPEPPAAPAPPPRRWELALKSAGTAGPWTVCGEVRIGRSPECEVPLADGMSSRVNTFIAEKEDGFWVRDAGSLNGTEVNGARIDAPVRLSEGDVIRVGDTDLVFREVEAVSAVSQAAAQAARPAFAAPPAAAASAPAQPVAAHVDAVDLLFGDAPAPRRAEPAAPLFPQPGAVEPAGGEKFCTDCGGRNGGDANFCIHCGRRL